MENNIEPVQDLLQGVSKANLNSKSVYATGVDNNDVLVLWKVINHKSSRYTDSVRI